MSAHRFPIPSMRGFAFAALLLPAIVSGHLALAALHKAPDRSRDHGMAPAGTILGYIGSVIFLTGTMPLIFRRSF